MKPNLTAIGSYATIVIGSGEWIAGRVTVLECVRSGARVVVGACSVVPRDVPLFAVAVGNTARIVRHRFGHGPARPWRLRLAGFGS